MKHQHEYCLAEIENKHIKENGLIMERKFVILFCRRCGGYKKVEIV